MVMILTRIQSSLSQKESKKKLDWNITMAIETHNDKFIFLDT